MCVRQVSESIGRCILKKLKIYSPLSSITNSQSEGYNTLLKFFENRKEAPLDSMILDLYQLQVYFYNEIQRLHTFFQFIHLLLFRLTNWSQFLLLHYQKLLQGLEVAKILMLISMKVRR